MKTFLLLILLLSAAGCQTFTLSREEFEMQQRGESADHEVGHAVDAVGTAAYVGSAIGAAVAGVEAETK